MQALDFREVHHCFTQSVTTYWT